MQQKNESKTTHEIDAPINSRQFLTACRGLLSDQFLVNVFHVSGEQILRYTADPDYTSEEYPRENPIEKLERILRKCVSVPGGDEVARAMVRRLAGIVGCRLAPENLPATKSKDICRECLEDIPALASYHAALTDPGSTMDRIRACRESLEIELDENEAVIANMKRG